MGVSGVKLDKNKIIKALHAKKGIIEHAATQVPCDPTAIYQWMKKDEDVALAVKEARENADKERADKDEIIKEYAYQSIIDLLTKKDTTATLFALKSKCGWAEKTITHDHAITIQTIDKPYREQKNPDPL